MGGFFFIFQSTMVYLSDRDMTCVFSRFTMYFTYFLGKDIFVKLFSVGPVG